MDKGILKGSTLCLLLTLVCPAARPLAAGDLFDAPRGVASATVFVGCAAGDCNGDGKLDLVIADEGPIMAPSSPAGLVAVLLGRGDGTFEEPIRIPIAGLIKQVALGDFNGDGKLDIAAALMRPVARDSYSNSIVLFPGEGNGSFRQPGLETPTGLPPAFNPPVDIASADIDHDGNADLILPFTSGDILLVKGSSNGQFAVQQIPTFLFHPYAMAAADFNHDGYIDFALTNPYCSDSERDGPFKKKGLAVFLNDGKGGFEAPFAASTNECQKGIAAADFDHDGNLDLATIAGDAGYPVEIFFGRNDGSFAKGPDYYPIIAPAGVLTTLTRKAGGIVDLVVPSQDVTYLLPGSPTGIFESARSSPAGMALPRARLFCTGDFDGDGIMDLFQNGTLYKGKAEGLVQSPPTYRYGGVSTSSLAVGDFDGDGASDLVAVPFYAVTSNGVALADSPGIISLHGRGDGTFTSARSVVADWKYFRSVLRVADFDGDGKADAAAFLQQGELQILSDNGRGELQIRTTFPISGGTYAALTADLNADGRTDLVALSTGGASHEDGQVNTNGFIQVLLGDGNRSFASPAQFAQGLAPQAIALTDVNSDGKPDLVFTSSGVFSSTNGFVPRQGFYVAIGDGRGSFGQPVLHALAGEGRSVLSGDFNGDGNMDLLIIVFPAADLLVFLGDGSGSFAREPLRESLNKVPFNWRVVDFDQDGFLDLVGQDGWSASVRLGRGDGHFAPAILFSIGGESMVFDMGDLNHDGRPDLVIASNCAPLGGSPFVSDEGAMVLLNTAAPQLKLLARRSGQHINLSWPANFSAMLETAPNLTNKQWSQKGGVLSTNLGRIELELSLQLSSEFFRLRTR